MTSALRRATLLVVTVIATLLLTTCSGIGASGEPLFVQELTNKAQTYSGKDVTVQGAYVWRPQSGETPNLSVLALGVSTLDSGRDAQPLGEPIWLENFPEGVGQQLHNPGDSIYGFVKLSGMFETAGNYGPQGQYKYRIAVRDVQPIEQVQRVEQRIENKPAEDGTVSFFDLAQNPEQYNGQTITTQGYYFWNSVIYVLAEGVSTEDDGASPVPVGQTIWMEGFPPPVSAQLNVGPNNSFVWGLVEVTGTFQAGGNFGKDGAYPSQFTIVDGKARALEPPQ